LRCCLTLSLLSLAAPAFAAGPADLRTPADVVFPAAYVRYLDLAPIPPAEREGCLSRPLWAPEHLSRAATSRRPDARAGDRREACSASTWATTRPITKDLQRLVTVWEQLADADPYYHQRVTLAVQEDYVWPGGVSPKDGKYYPPGTKYSVPTGQTAGAKTVLAPWLAPTEKHKKALAVLTTLTYTQAPLVRGDWFFNQTAADVDRKPGYHDFLGFADQKTFEKLIGFDAKLFAGFSVEVRASVGLSGVSLQPRAIARFGSLGGGYWKTFDFRKAAGGNDPLAVLGRDIEKGFDATEVLAPLPNGFIAWGLFNAKGVRQDTAPDFVASDGMSKSNDRRVHNNASCVRCHFEGLHKPVDDWTRDLLNPPPGLSVLGYDYQALKLLRQQYTKKLDPLLAKDRDATAAAILEATGWTAPRYSQQYGEWWSRYEDARVDLVWAERSLGVPAATIKAAVHKAVQHGKGDLVLAFLLKEGKAVPIRVWEEKYAAAQEVIRAFGGVK
jgi:hypothetical protein